jgi:putative hydrolases of HD superfamily
MYLLHEIYSERLRMKEINSSKLFEHSKTQLDSHKTSARIAQTSLELGKAAMYFSRITRAPRYADGERESDTEHSFMLALVAPELARALGRPLDIGLVTQFATVHDLVELKTNDVATFLFDDDQQHSKELTEKAALAELLLELPPHTASLLERYESQTNPEARFVRYVDKLLPVVVDIIGAGERVMREDFGVRSIDALKECHVKLQERLVRMFGEEFPEITLAHELLCELFESKFTENS